MEILTSKRVVFLMIVITLIGYQAWAGVKYDDPAGGWAYQFEGDSASPGSETDGNNDRYLRKFDALDGTWDHSNSSDEWDGTEIGAGAPGGVIALIDGATDFIRIQDTGDPRGVGYPDPSNRKLYLAHSMNKDIGGSANTILDKGATLTFRAKLSTGQPLHNQLNDNLWPTEGDGYLIDSSGKGHFSIRQATDDQVLSFSLALPSDHSILSDTMGGLLMNDLNGTSSTSDVDTTDSPGTLNLLEMDITEPNEWHEFWITIEPDETETGTHKVSIWKDGELGNPVTFIVTAGNGDDYDDSYIGMGCHSTWQTGAIDIDFFAYKAGSTLPPGTLIVDGGSDLLLTSAQGTAGVSFAPTLTTDLELSTLDVVWDVLSGPEGSLVTFSPSAEVLNPTISFSTPGFYEVQIQVTANAGQPNENVVTDVVQVWVKDSSSNALLAHWQFEQASNETAPDAAGNNPGGLTYTGKGETPDTESGLLAHWKLDEASGTVALDATGNGHDGTLMNFPVWQPTGGKKDGAVAFDGSDQSIVVADASFLDGLDALTICVWVKSSVTNTDKGFIIFEDPVGNDDRDMRYDKAGATGGGTDVIKIGITSTGGVQQLESSNGAQTTEWQHVAMTWRSGDALILYINGEVDIPTANSSGQTGTLTDYMKIMLGKGGKDATASWNGLIDDVRIYNRALNVADVSELANLGETVPLGQDPTLTEGWVTEEGQQNALSFDGTGYVEAVEDEAADPNLSELEYAVTLSAWIQVEDYNKTWQTILAKGDSSWRLSRQGNTDSVHFACSGEAGVSLAGISTVNDGFWHHVLGVYDGMNGYLYVDGVLEAQTNRTTIRPIAMNDEPVRIGSNSEEAGREWIGSIDDVRVYNYALAPTEIETLFSMGSDFAIGFDLGGMPNPLVPGDKLNIPVLFKNYLPTKLDKQAGAVSIYLLPEDTPAPGAGDNPFAQINLSTNVAARSSKTITAKATVPNTLDIVPGSYQLYLELADSLTGAGGVLEGIGIMSGDVELAWRFGDLSGLDANRRKGVKLSLSGAGGATYQMSLNGSGWGEILPAGGELHGAGFLLSDTTEKSTLKLAAKNDADFFVGDISTNGSLKSLSGKGVDLDGDITIAGTIKQLVMNDVLFLPGVSESHLLTINGGDPASASQAAKFTFNRINDLTVNCPQMPIKMFTAAEWCDTDGSAPEEFNAPWVSKLTIKGNSKENISGDMEVDVRLSGEGAPKDLALGSGKIAGSIRNGDWFFGKNAGAISAGSMEDTLLFVGAADGITEPNDTETIFAPAHYRLGTLSLGGQGGVDMFNCTLAAWTLDGIKLSNTGTATGEVYYVNLDREKKVTPDEKDLTFIQIIPNYLVLSATAVSDTQIDLTWIDTNEQTADHYEVHRGTESEFALEPGALLSDIVSDNSYSDTTVPTSLTMYYYKVVAVYGGNIDPYESNEASAIAPSYLETESGTLGVLWQTLSDSEASGGQYIEISTVSSAFSNPPGADGIATYEFSIAQAGTYKVWGRILVPTDVDDSFWVRIADATSSQITRGDDWIKWNNTELGSVWHWDAIHNADQSSTEVEFTLPVGPHTLEIGYREDGARWDRIAIGSVDFTPSD